MKKAFIYLLLVSCMLTGCKQFPSAEDPPVSVSDVENTRILPTTIPSAQDSEVTDPEAIPVEQTVPSDPLMLELEVPKDITPTETTPPVTPPPVVEKPTVPPVTEPAPTVPAPTHPPETEPPVTEPPETQPTEPKPTEPTPTEPPKESIDAAAIESAAESYAKSLGFTIDTSLGKGSGGYYPPEYAPLTSTSEGKKIAKGLVSATKNQLNSRFSEEYCDVLVEDAHGLVRMNCTVVYSHTDEFGDWYTIYVFYG